MASRWILHPITAIVQFFMRRVASEEVTGISIDWTVDDQPVLFMTLLPDGAICRMGSGSLDNEDTEFFIGNTEPQLFEQVRPYITTDLLNWIGYRWDSKPEGRTCFLKIGLILAKGKGRLIGFKYGADSMNLPPEVSRFIAVARAITNPWHEEFRANARIGTQGASQSSVSEEKSG